jgi:ribonuclease PH
MEKILISQETSQKRSRLNDHTVVKTLLRADGRAHDHLRPVTIEPNYLAYAEGSALISVGHTRVLCAATLEEKVPPWMRGRGQGWITAEYAMLPRATQERTQREVSKGRLGGRTHEIQRLIGRSLRAILDPKLLGERTVTIDCDVVQADGGTRTAAITGAYVALALALRRVFDPASAKWPLARQLAAVSVGFVEGVPHLDLAYSEDSRADVDMNVAMTDAGTFVEIQGTAEVRPFDRAQLDTLLALAESGITQLFAYQKAALAAAPVHGA